MAEEAANRLVMIAVETSLGARFLTSAAATVTFAELRGLLEIEHFSYFPNHGKITMDTMQVEYDCKMYHVRDTLFIGQVSQNNWVKVHAKAYSEASKDVQNVNHPRSLQCTHPANLMEGTSWANCGATLVDGCGPIEGAAHDFDCTKRQGSTKKACWHCRNSSLCDKFVLQEMRERSCHCEFNVLLAKRSSNAQGDLPCMLLSSEGPCTQAWLGSYVEAPTTLNKVLIQAREKRHKKKKQPQRVSTSPKTLLNTSENADLETQHAIQLVCEVAGETGKGGASTCNKLETCNNNLQGCNAGQETDCCRPQLLIENERFTEENGQKTGFSGPNISLQHQASLSKHDMLRSPRSGFEQEMREETVGECNLGDGKVNSVAKKDQEPPQTSCKTLLKAFPEPSPSKSSSTMQQANDDTRKGSDAMTNDTSDCSKQLQSLSELCVSNNGLHNPQPASLVADIVFETQESQMATQFMILNKVNMETGILSKEAEEGALGHRTKKKRKRMKCTKPRSPLGTGANLEAVNLIKETVSTNLKTMDKIDRGTMTPELDQSVGHLEVFEELLCSSLGAKSKVKVSDKDRWVENLDNQAMPMDKIDRGNMTLEVDRPGGHLEECQESPCSSLHAKSKVKQYQMCDKDGLVENKDSEGIFDEQERSSEVGFEREFNEVSKSSFDEQERSSEAVLERELKEVSERSFDEQERSSEAVLERKSSFDQVSAEFDQEQQITKDLNLSRTDKITNTGCSHQDMPKEDSLVDRLDGQNEADKKMVETKGSLQLPGLEYCTSKGENIQKRGRKKRKKRRRIEQEILHLQADVVTVGMLSADKDAQADQSSSQCSQNDLRLDQQAEDANELELAKITDAVEEDQEQDRVDVDYSEHGKCRKKKRKRKDLTKAESVGVENTDLNKSTEKMHQSDIGDSPSALDKNRKAVKKSLNVFEFDGSGNDEPEKTSSSRQGNSQETQNLDKLCTAAIEVVQDEDHDLAKVAYRKTGRKCVNPKRWITVLSERLMQSQCPKNGKTKKKSATTSKTRKIGARIEEGNGILGPCMEEGDDSSFQNVAGNDLVQQEEEKQESTANNDGKIACPVGCGRLYSKKTSAYYRHRDRCLKKRNCPQ